MKSIKKALTTTLACSVAVAAMAGSPSNKKGKEDYKFETVKELEYTSIKSQHRSGTCWSFSGQSFLESEMLRKGKPTVDLSEMFVVYHCYSDKAEKAVRLHGNLNFSPGGAFHDVTYVLGQYGAVPEEVYNGLQYGEEGHTHGEMDAILAAQVDAVIKNKNKKLSPAWKKSVDGTLDAYLGELPESFEYEGKEYTPKTFVSDFMDLNASDYVQISSYSHHPFYSQFVIEVPDNWMFGNVYNVKLEELTEIMDNSIMNGYSIGWAADVSERGFATSKQGVAVIPDVNRTEMSDSEISKWEEMSSRDQENKLYQDLNKPCVEKVITQEMRQEAYDNYETTDDHGMHIVGIVKDQTGKEFYKVKNSWGEYNKYDGFFYASKAFIDYKTMSIMVHKDAIPADIRKKLGL